eukprot:COSAG02_NODE_2_length_75708_cov_87.013953_30_plen_1000_part_00
MRWWHAARTSTQRVGGQVSSGAWVSTACCAAPGRVSEPLRAPVLADDAYRRVLVAVQDGQVKQMGKDKLNWNTVKSKFSQMQEAHNARYNYLTGSSRALDDGYVGVIRSGNMQSPDITRVTRADLYDDSRWNELKGKAVIFQAYVPVKTATRASNGTVYRTEFEQPRRNKYRMQTYKMVYMTGVDGTVVNEKGQEVPADKCQQALKCTAVGLKEHLNAMTMEMVRYIESAKRTHLATLAAEFMVEEADGQPLLTHLTSVVTAQLPKVYKREVPANPRISRLLDKGPPSSSIDQAPVGDQYDILNKKSKQMRRKKENEEELVEEEPRDYVLPFKSVLLARLDEATSQDNETPRYSAIRKMALTAELSKLDPAHFYRQVKVTETYYRKYNLLDEQRKKDVEEGKRIVRTQLEKHSKSQQDEWWKQINGDGDEAKTVLMAADDLHKFNVLCRRLCRNENLCQRLCEGSSSIKKKGELPKLLKKLVDNTVQSIKLYDEEKVVDSEWSTAPAPPWTLTSDKAKWRRSVSPAFEPSGYGAKTEAQVIAEAEAKIARARRKQQAEDEFSRSRSQLRGASGRKSPAYPRSESAPPLLPSINASRRANAPRVSGAPNLHQRSALPVVAAAPAVTASRSSAHNFPHTLPGSDDLRSRHALDTSSIEYEHLYKDDSHMRDSGIEYHNMESGGSGMPSPPPAAQQPAPPEDGSAELYASSQPVEGQYARVGDLTMKYTVVHGAGEGTGPALRLVCFNDFFDSYEKYASFLQPLVDKAPAGSQLLCFNFPGQAHTEHGPEGSTMNNVVLAQCFDALLTSLQNAGSFAGGGAPITLLGVGNGANVATYWMRKTVGAEAESSRVKSLVVVNPFTGADAHMSLVLQNWLNTCDISQLFQFDLQLYFFSHLLFSEKYLVEKTPTVAFESYTAHPNPISLAGRAAICRGAQSHEPLELEAWSCAAPTVLIVGDDDHLLKATGKKSFLAKQNGESQPMGAGAVHCVELEGGHEVRCGS